MHVKSITTDDLRHMKNSEGLILQGCGGNLKEWIDGINELLTKAEILLDGSKFGSCSVFTHNGVTCLLFPFTDDVKLDMGRLAMWRINTHGYFGGTWLSDFVQNQIGGFIAEKAKPDCPLIGQDGNIFNLLGIASRTLRENHMIEDAKAMCDRVYASGSYEEALGIIGQYVNITSVGANFNKEMVLS